MPTGVLSYYPPPDAAFCEESDGLLVVGFVPHQLLHVLPRSLALHIPDLRVGIRQAQEKLEAVKLFGGRKCGILYGEGLPAVLGSA